MDPPNHLKSQVPSNTSNQVVVCASGVRLVGHRDQVEAGITDLEEQGAGWQRVDLEGEGLGRGVCSLVEGERSVETSNQFIVKTWTSSW